MPDLPATSRRALRFTLVATILGSAIGFLDGTILTVALPRISDELHLVLSMQQWVTVGYLLALVATYLLAGAIGDRMGQRRVFIYGTAGFALASLVAGLAQSAGPLLAARVAQGVAGAFLSTTSLALLRITWAKESARAIGLWTAGTSIATVVGPIVGGVVTDHYSWRWLFFINLPVAAMAIVLVLAGREPATADGPAPSADQSAAAQAARGRLDVTGAVLGALGISGVTWLLVQGPADGWARAAPAGVAGAALLVAFLWWEARAADPVLPLGLFRIRDFTIANLATFLVYAGLGGSFFYYGLYLQSSPIRLTATNAALVTLPVSIVMIALAARFGRFADSRGPRLLLTAGPLLMGLAMACMALVGSRTDYVFLGGGALLFGLGLAMVVAPITATALQAVPERSAGIAAAVNTAVARFGSILCVAAMGVVVTASFHPHGGISRDTPFDRGSHPRAVQAEVRHAYRWAMLVAIAVTAAGGVAAGLGLRSGSRHVSAAGAEPGPANAPGSDPAPAAGTDPS